MLLGSGASVSHGSRSNVNKGVFRLKSRDSEADLVHRDSTNPGLLIHVDPFTIKRAKMRDTAKTDQLCCAHMCTPRAFVCGTFMADVKKQERIKSRSRCDWLRVGASEL